MAIHLALYHDTHYTYDSPVRHGPHIVRLRPAPHCRTRILSYSQRITGGAHFLNWQQDPFSNWNGRLVFPDPMREFRVEVELVIEMAVYNPLDFFLEEGATHFPFRYSDTLAQDLLPFLTPSPLTPAVSACLSGIARDLLSTAEVLDRPDYPPVDAPPFPLGTVPPERVPMSPGGAGAYLHAKSSEWLGRPVPTLDFLIALNQRIQAEIRYLIRLEPGVQTPEQTLAQRSGSCRDSSWLLVQLLRHLGLAARFVSGYLIQMAPDVPPLDGPAGPEADFGDLHAWCEVYLPGAGWIGLDPTSGLLAGEGHIPLSGTPEPGTAAPVEGATEPCQSTLHHQLRVRRIHESPRVSRPYSEAQWLGMDQLGQAIDEDLLEVRLAMGGKPTFVSIEDPDGPEWKDAAVSQRKRELTGELIQRLRARFAPGALLHYGLEEWHPGEPQPRWVLSAIWRKDGVPLWRDDGLIAGDGQDYGVGNKEALILMEALARALHVDVNHVRPGCEDPFQYAWKERRPGALPTPEKVRMEERLEPDQMARILHKGNGEIAGYALPIEPARDGQPAGWLPGRWVSHPHEGTLWLVPGCAPMGLRLPPDLRAGNSEGIRSALCVEAREGRLHVFIPLMTRTEAFLDLVTVVEQVVARLGWPVIVEGEPPMPDPHLNRISVRPKPGVIEVNPHPSRSWPELVERTEALYEAARQSRLGTEKFMLDGRFTGTGGGDPIVLGGEAPLDSPFLRRPDLLRSLVSYWQNHPSLSRLFSGMFIGPNSPAPRLDEARTDSLYELEIAFAELDQRTGFPPAGAFPRDTPRESIGGETGSVASLVDLLFRNLLAGPGGHPGRAEISIDQLFNSASPQGWRGELELRAFEMAPHPRMSLAQHLLLRGLIAWFWRKPYRDRLVRWGTSLHDRWLLPHFCERDFRDVLQDLREAGHPFEFDWFAPHFEFRFPRLGDFVQRDVRVELRLALEPRHRVESNSGGQTGPLDCSVERLQVQVRGMLGERFMITCNGRRVPLQPTGTHGESVAGVRYRAWQPPQCPQPALGIHSPLVFDLFDTWNERSLGGCTYHVAHPGGRNHTTLPVNAYEAESRRLARFFRMGHYQGNFDPRDEPAAPEGSCTLDLRKGASMTARGEGSARKGDGSNC